VTGIVLAGGRSTRFGSDKLVAQYRGMPLVHHAILRLAEVCEEIIVVAAPNAPDPELPSGVEAILVRDAVEGQGPLAGLLAGLEATGTDLAVVAGGDMPELSTAVLVEMLRVARESEVDAVALQDGDRLRPLPIVVRTARARDVTHALFGEGQRRLRSLLQDLNTAVIDEPTWTGRDPERDTLHDVDEPGDMGA
jgi:molybdopterin-guanine dinucleotide biosynthesis protein A